MPRHQVHASSQTPTDLDLPEDRTSDFPPWRLLIASNSSFTDGPLPATALRGPLAGANRGPPNHLYLLAQSLILSVWHKILAAEQRLSNLQAGPRLSTSLAERKPRHSSSECRPQSEPNPPKTTGKTFILQPGHWVARSQANDSCLPLFSSSCSLIRGSHATATSISLSPSPSLYLPQFVHSFSTEWTIKGERVTALEL